MPDVYTLALECIDPGNCRWAIRRRRVIPDTGNPDMTEGEYIASANHDRRESMRSVHRWATGELHALCVRTIEWRMVDPAATIPDMVYYAHTGPWRGSWEVTEYTDRDGLPWSRTSDPERQWRNSLGGTVADLEALEARRGPIIPTRVHNLPALLAELAIMHRVAGYLRGDGECFEHECDGYDENYQLVDKTAEHCPHVTYHVARAEQVFELGRIREEMDSMRKAATLAVDPAHPLTDDELAERELTVAIVDQLTEAAKREDTL